MKSLIVAICLLLSSCLSYDVNFKNAEGKTAYCRGHGWGFIGAPLAYSNKQDCISKTEAKGFRKEE